VNNIEKGDGSGGFSADLWLELVSSVRNQFKQRERNENRTEIILYFSSFCGGFDVCVSYVCVPAHTHTARRVLRYEPMCRKVTPEEPERNPDILQR